MHRLLRRFFRGKMSDTDIVMEDLSALFDMNMAEARVAASAASSSAMMCTSTTREIYQKKSWKNRRGRKRRNGDGAELVETLDEVEVKRALRPNYFLALKIDDEEIVQSAKELQDSIVSKEPLLRKAVIQPPTFHITLFVLTLKNEAEVSRAVELLETSDLSVDEPLELEFHGLGHFRNQVLFAKPSEGTKNEENGAVERLKQFQNRIWTHFASSELEVEGNGGFEPHLTLFKLSKDPRLRKAGLKKISPDLYMDHMLKRFGSQRVGGVQLLSMLKPKDSKGYYHCCRQVDISIARNLSTSPISREEATERHRKFIKVMACASGAALVLALFAWSMRRRH